MKYMKVSVVNFHPVWGDKQRNRDKMISFVQKAAEEGSKLILFPETALTGYENEPDVSKKDKMQIRLAETLNDETALLMAQLSSRFHMYIVYGFPERDSVYPDIVYNAAAVICPDGRKMSYHKIHLPADESDWAAAGDEPMVFDTEYGKIGLSICYDTYSFPELIRYAKAKGARLFLNPTACNDDVFHAVPLQMQLEEHSLTNSIFIASANLCGDCHSQHFVGGSSIIGMKRNTIKEAAYYAGFPFGFAGSCKEDVYTADLDLSIADEVYGTPMYIHNPQVGHPDFRPEIYAKMYAALSADSEWRAKCS
ncbi:MAG: carbon-nitrogen hydrolase family protein [Roseburia sp.]|nr:carbon-nitrogen hydrolase family protein [Roseburia sp.]